jgi:glycosyltransferase involved in cell wall biosynthesis
LPRDQYQLKPMKLTTRLISALNRRKLVTWERTDPEACVLMITNAWPHPEHPTQGTFVQYTIDGLDAQGVRCDVLFVRGYRGWHAYLLGCVAMALLPSASKGKYRLVHSHGGETALVARFFHSVPVLASYLGSDILGPQEGNLRSRMKCFVRSKILRGHSLLMSATTTKSDEMASLLPPHARSRNWVIPDGVNRSRFSPAERNAARRQISWPLDETTVISVGERVSLKRLWLAEQATALATREIQSLRWRVLSDVAPQEMPLYYNAADCLIHTSASEGSPNAVKEALACNLPVVATPAGDIAELLTGVTPSALCAPEPAVLAREIVRCVVGKQRSDGRERTRHLGLEEITARTLECYASLGIHIRLDRAPREFDTTQAIHGAA